MTWGIHLGLAVLISRYSRGSRSQQRMKLVRLEDAMSCLEFEFALKPAYQRPTKVRVFRASR